MTAQKSRMYENVETWGIYKGCEFDCSYCKPSFQRQAKRQKHNCKKCYDYKPHEHPERLNKIPSVDTVFIAGNGDISFASPKYVRKIIEAVRWDTYGYPDKTFFFQSKRPICFKPFLKEFPKNVILLTTLETNRNKGYKNVSKAPVPSIRYRQFKNLDYPRKVVTVEPIMDFDLNEFGKMLIDLEPEYVYIGFDSHPKDVKYPEPPKEKVLELMQSLKDAGITVNEKEMWEAE